jgi:hypothetical protein
VSEATSARLEAFSRHAGIRKSLVVEDAIISYLDAREQMIPASAIIPTRIVLSKESGDEFLRAIDEEPNPTDALCKLMQARRT